MTRKEKGMIGFHLEMPEDSMVLCFMMRRHSKSYGIRETSIKRNRLKILVKKGKIVRSRF